MFVVFSDSALAAQQLMALHGKAVSSGSAISSGDLRVLIYDANQGGNLVYDSGSDFNGSIVNSFFDVILGSVTGLDLNYGSVYYMDIRVNGQDLNFGGTDRRSFESSRGQVKGSSIFDGSITNSDINLTAAIDWNKISKTGSRLSDLGFDSDFNATYARQSDANQWFVKSSDINNIYYTQSDANNVLLKKVDANSLYPIKADNETISGNWTFNGSILGSGGFGSGGLTLQNGIGYFKSIVVLNDFNAATVTGIDLNGNYLPDPDNTWDLGSGTRRFKKIYGVDANFSGSALIGTLTLNNALGVSSGGTGSTSFPSGGIVFSNGSILTSDGNIFWDNTSKRLGIGTSSPQNTLNVIGDLNVTGSSYLGNVSISASDINAEDINVSGTATIAIANIGTLNTSNIAGFVKDSVFNAAWPVNDANVTDALTINTPNYAIFRADLNALGGLNANILRSFDNNSLSLQTNNTTRLAIASTGNVGIGTTNPTNTLTVAGDLNVTGVSYLGNVVISSYDINVTNIRPSDQNLLILGKNGVEIARVVGSGSTFGNVGIGTSTPTALLYVSDVNGNSAVAFRVDGNSLAANATAFVVTKDGNAGIGTASPGAGYRLDVNGNTNISGDLNVSQKITVTDINILGSANIAGISGYVRDSVFNATFPVGDTNVDNNLTINTTNNAIFRSDLNAFGGLSANVVGSLDNNVLSVRTNNLPRLTITADGNIGIGTVLPKNALNVSGDLNVTGVSYLGSVIISANDVNVNNINSRDGNITFNSNTGAERVRIVGTSGNVGIGTTTPTSKLHVAGDANITGDLNAELSWFLLKNYPSACPSGQFVNAVGDTLTCSTIPGGGGGRTYIGISPIVTDNDLNTIALNVLSSSDWNGLFDGKEGTYYLNFGNDTNRLFSLLTLDDNSSFDLRYIKISDTNNTARVSAGAIGGLTTGRLLFGAGNGTITQDGNIFWDNTAKRLGIGTGSPSAILHISDTDGAAATALRVDGNSLMANATAFVVTKDGNVAVALTAPTAGFRLDVNGDVRVVGDLNVGKKATVQDLNILGNLTISGSLPGYVRDAVFNNSFPIADANVDNNITIDTNQNAVFRGNVITRQDLNALGGLNANAVRSLDNNALVLQTNNSTRVTVAAADGNVGIATVPGTGFRLDVNGDIRGSGDLNIGKKITALDINVLGTATIGTLVTGNISGFVRDSVFNATFPVADANVDNNITLNDLNQITNRPFSRLTDRNISLITWDSNSILDGRYIKISDSNNAARLDYQVIANPPSIPSGQTIDSNINFVLAQRVPWADANVDNNLTIDTNQPAVFRNSVIARVDINAYGGLNANTVSSLDNNNLTLRTNNAARLTITSAGNIGIGTITPQNALNVAGDINGSGTGYFTTAVNTPLVITDTVKSISGDIAFQDSSGNERVRFKGSFPGIGIGTTPLQELEIATAVPNIRVRDSDSSGASSMPSIEVGGTNGGVFERVGYVGDESTTLQTMDVFGDSGSILRLGANNAEVIRITTNGNVGISQTEPTNKLNIIGDLNILASATALPSLYIRASDGNIGVNTVGGAGFRLDVNGNERVAGDLNVGGKITTQDLNVVGTAVINTIITNTISGFVKDSVFNASYPWQDANVDNNLTIDTNQAAIFRNSIVARGDVNAVVGLNTNTLRSLDNNALVLQTNNLARVTVAAADGNVGVAMVSGTGFRLDVNGNIRGSGDLNIGQKITTADLNVLGTAVINTIVTNTIAGYVKDSVFNASYPWQDANVDNNITIDTNKAAVFAGNVTTRADLNALGGLNANTIRSFDNNALSLQTLNTARLTIGTDGNVGIGTTGPKSTLNVSGDFNVSPGGAPAFLVSNVGGNNKVGINTNTIASASNVRLHVSYDGKDVNSGLVTSDPIILTAENTAAGFSIIVAADNGSGVRPVFKGTRSRGTLATPLTPQKDDDVLTFLSAVYDSNFAGGNQATAGIFFKLDQIPDFNRLGQRISFVTSDSNAAQRQERMVIKADGNVGINASSPVNRLNLVGDLNVISSATVGYPSLFVAAGDGNTGVRMVPGSGFALDVNGDIRGSGDLNVGKKITVSDLNVLGTATINTLVTGNISGFVKDSVFNASYPWQDANVDNNITIDTNKPAVFAGSIITRADNNALGGLNVNTLRSFDNNTLNLQTLNTTRLTIGTDGNIGVNNVAPKGKFNVIGDVNIATSATAVPSIYISSVDGNVAIAGTAVTTGYRLDVTGNERVSGDLNVSSKITATDLNVLGTASIANIPGFVRDAVFNASFPVFDANIDNNITIDTNKAAVFAGNVTTRADLNALGGLNANTIRSFDNNALSLQTQNTARITVTADGNVGIGVSTTSFALDVNNTNGSSAPLRVSGINTAGLVSNFRRVSTFNDLNIMAGGSDIGMTFSSSVNKYALGYKAVSNVFKIVTLGQSVSSAASILDSNSGLIIAWDGNVGIGTSAPSRALSVIGDANVTGTLYAGSISGIVSGYVTDAVFNASWPVLDANVDNNITIDTNKAAIFGSNVTARADLNALGGLNTNTLRSLDNNALSIQTNNTTRATVTADGNFGIGTTTPKNKLEVAGDVNLSTATPRLTLGTAQMYKTAGGELVIST